MTLTRRCLACSADNGLAARFCRRCGASLAAFDDLGAPLELAAEAERLEPPLPVDGQRVFAELCWLSGSLIVISAGYGEGFNDSATHCYCVVKLDAAVCAASDISTCRQCCNDHGYLSALDEDADPPPCVCR